jgi:3-oxocholest-4-en-26-oate---CoA ligase
MDWNYGDILDVAARSVPPERDALIWGDVVVSWGDFDRRSNNIGKAMIAAGLKPDDKAAILCRNHPAYLEAFAGALKSRTVNVNINYRYTADEIVYVMEDSQARALFFQDTLDNHVAELKQRLPNVILWVRIETGRKPVAPLEGELSFETLAETGDGAPIDIKRSPTDAYLLYTGGTTGKPKGVVWSTGESRKVQLESPWLPRVPKNLEEQGEIVRANPAPGRIIPACPLMHGSGSNAAIGELLNGGTAILLPSDRFSAEELWGEVERCRATRIAIVGDVFARPMATALEDHPGRWDVSSLKMISSAGLIWSGDVKQRLLERLPTVSLIDIVGASEASFFGYSIATKGNVPATGIFIAGPHMTIVDPDTGRVLPYGEPGEGLLARSGSMATGYYRDEKKTSETYRVIDGVRYAVPGDFARRNADGTFMLIGRGNLSINTGGEKVFPEEVEEALKLAPGVEDALVVGEPHETFGKSIVAIVSVNDAFDEETVRQSLLKTLAGYKLPRRYIKVAQVPRHESGKSDYRTANAIVAEDIRVREGAQ